MADTAKQKKQLFKMYNFQRGLCHWCGIKMIPPWKHKHITHKTMDPTMCTFDHLDDKFSSERGQHNGKYRNVAACWQCNFDRGIESQKSVGIEELRKRSQH